MKIKVKIAFGGAGTEVKVIAPTNQKHLPDSICSLHQPTVTKLDIMRRVVTAHVGVGANAKVTVTKTGYLFLVND